MSDHQGPLFGLRARIWLTVLLALASVLIALTAGFNLVLSSRLRHEANSVASARATAELGALRVIRSAIDLVETPDGGALDTPTWVFQGTRPLESPRADPPIASAAAALTASPRGFRDVGGTDTRLYAVPVLQRSRRVGTVVSAVALGPYEQTQRVALIGSSVLALLGLLAVALATRWLIARALAPVAQMTRQAAQWSEHDLDRRFSLGEPRDEFTTLAATLDGLLDRVATSLRHEQNLTAELSHELRTPLTQISAEAQYALRHAENDEDRETGYRRILLSARQMTRILETLIAAARAQSGPRRTASDAEAGARAAISACKPLAAQRDIELVLHAPAQRISAGVDGGLLERVLSPVLENACRYASSTVSLHISGENSRVDFTIEDNGPGIPREDFETVFVPGYRASTGQDDGHALQGAGLGLALARRLARGVGGEVRVAGSDTGAKFVVSLPHA